VSETVVETTLLDADRRMPRNCSRGWRNPTAWRSRLRSPPLGRSNFVRYAIGTGSPDCSHRVGHCLAAPIAWFNLRRHLGKALQSESRGGTSGRATQFCVIASSSRRLPWRSFCWLEPVCSASVFTVRRRFLGLPVRPHPDRANLASMGRLPDGTARLTFVESLMVKVGHLPGGVRGRG